MCTCANGNYDHCDWQEIIWNGEPGHIISSRGHINIPVGHFFKLILKSNKKLTEARDVYVYVGPRVTIEKAIVEDPLIYIKYILETEVIDKRYNLKQRAHVPSDTYIE